MSEFDQRYTVDGGYQELSRLGGMIRYARMQINGEDEEEAGVELIEDNSPPFNPHEEVPGDHH